VIIATMLSGNAAGIVRDAAASVAEWIDLLLLLDTGITDDTESIVRDVVGPRLRVERIGWRNDFAWARNTALERAAALGGDWALTIDTDERLAWPGFASIADLRTKLASDSETLTWMVADRAGTYRKERFVRLPSPLVWRERTHEALCGSTARQRSIMVEACFHEQAKSEADLQHKFTRDVEILLEETRARPDHGRAWYYLGQSYDGLRRDEEAVEAFRRCAAVSTWAEEAAIACFKAAIGLCRLGRHQAALDTCVHGLAKHASMPELAWQAGYCNFHLGRYDDAMHWSEMAIAIGAVQGSNAGRDRIGLRDLVGWYEGPFDILRFACRKLGRHRQAEEAEQKYLHAKARRLRIAFQAGELGDVSGGDDAPTDAHATGSRIPVTDAPKHSPRPRVAVLGAYRSGSSAIAGILYHLGVAMGREFWGEYFEPRDLAEQLRAWWNEPDMTSATSSADRVAGLARWLRDMEDDGPPAVGAKHPLLTLSGPDLLAAWGTDVRFIWACRPIEESIASLARCGWWPGREPAIQSTLAGAAERFFSRAAAPDRCLRIDFAAVLSDPAGTVDRIIGHVGIDPGPQRRARAIDSIGRRAAS